MPLLVAELHARFEADFAKEHADTFRAVQHPGRSSRPLSLTETRADYVLANPPFNESDTARRARHPVHRGKPGFRLPQRTVNP